ncbi:hypothetical protein C5S53_08510 [Methanophagales archaeon]|nr:hypothetical protein C5S53_08510 [Methanophagales archaeon]
MIEDYFTEIESLLIASPIVLSFKTSKEKISEDRGWIKGSVIFTNGTQMHLFEYVKIDNSPCIIKYAYHWQRKDGKLIKRWDNAPHHKGLETYPDHIHVGESVYSHENMDIKRVLDILEEE